MGFTRQRWTAIAAVAAVAVSSQLTPAGRAGRSAQHYLHRARGRCSPRQPGHLRHQRQQISTAPLSTVAWQRIFRPMRCWPIRIEQAMQVAVRWPYSANVHCEIDVDDHVAVQVDQVVHPAPGSTDPMNGVLPCGAPLPNP